MAKIKNKYRHLSDPERFVIERLWKKKTSVRGIALILDRSPDTIGREIKRNKVKGVYVATKAIQKAHQRRWRAKRQCLKVAMDSFLDRFVRERLKQKWSPKQISGYLKRLGIKVSAKAIYKFIWHRSLEHLLFWNWNKKRSGRKNYHYGNPTDGRKWIELRPEIKETGHYEIDFIVSKQSPWVLLVVVDIWLKKSWVLRLPNRKHHTICGAFRQVFSGKPLKSITTDNDIAFIKWQAIEELLNISMYFCHPYHSWEKGLVENTNRWIRCFVPKRREIGSVTQAEMEQIHAFLNDRPRECLGYFTANELYYQQQASYFGGC